MSLQGVKHCRRPQSVWIRMPGCGEEEGSQTTSKGSECWASQWATQAQLVSTTKKHATLYQRIQSVQDLQSAWLLLFFCANTRAIIAGHSPMKWLSLQQPTTKPVGSASQSCWAFPGARTDTVSPVCH